MTSASHRKIWQIVGVFVLLAAAVVVFVVLYVVRSAPERVARQNLEQFALVSEAWSYTDLSWDGQKVVGLVATQEHCVTTTNCAATSTLRCSEVERCSSVRPRDIVIESTSATIGSAQIAVKIPPLVKTNLLRWLQAPTTTCKSKSRTLGTLFVVCSDAGTRKLLILAVGY